MRIPFKLSFSCFVISGSSFGKIIDFHKSGILKRDQHILSLVQVALGTMREGVLRNFTRSWESS